MSECCKSGFRWNGTPTGTETTIASNKTYVSGTNKDVAIILIHDIFGWTLTNSRLLADHFATEANTTCFLPDFFNGEIVEPETMEDPEKRAKFDIESFVGRNGKPQRFPEMVAVAKAIREKGFKKIGAIGYCYGGWAVFQLGSKENRLVDAISTPHPSRLTKEEIDAVVVPTQIIAPELDYAFSPEMREYANTKIPSLGIPYQYDYYPGLAHGFAVRCDPNDEKQRNGMERAKNSAVSWFKEHLGESK